MYSRPTLLDLPFTSADQFIISDHSLLTPLKDWISTKMKIFKPSKKLENNKAISFCLFCCKQFLITVFKILCIFFFLNFSVFDVLIKKVFFALFCLHNLNKSKKSNILSIPRAQTFLKATYFILDFFTQEIT